MARPTSRVREPISEAVIRLREALGENQQQFANRLGTAITTIARYETSRPPSGQALVALAKLAVEHDRTDDAILFRKALEKEMGLESRGTPSGAEETIAVELLLLVLRNRHIAEVDREYRTAQRHLREAWDHISRAEQAGLAVLPSRDEQAKMKTMAEQYWAKRAQPPETTAPTWPAKKSKAKAKK